jgi:hypothetical protein
MLPKYMSDLFEPIHLPQINWPPVTWTDSALSTANWPFSHLLASRKTLPSLQISSGYRACRWMRQLTTHPANDN